MTEPNIDLNINITDRAVIVNHTHHCFKPSHIHREATRNVQAASGASRDAAQVVVRPLDKSFYGPIYNQQQRITRYIRFHTVPFENGTDLLDVDKLPTFMAEISKLIEELNQIRDEQMQKYPDLVANAPRDRMGKLHNPEYYPPVEEVRAKFKTVVTYDPVPHRKHFLMSLGEEQMQALHAQHIERMKGVERSVEQSLFDRLSKQVGDCCKALHPDTLRLHDSVFDTLATMVVDEPSLNLFKSAKVTSLYHTARQILLTKGVDLLRGDDILRGQVYTAACQFVATIPGWEAAVGEAKYDGIRRDLVPKINLVKPPMPTAPAPAPVVEPEPEPEPEPAPVVEPAPVPAPVVDDEEAALLASLGL